MRFFSRATQVDGSFTYAYTLAGHEYYANEDFQRSLQAYRTAVKLDPRHYNAWYPPLNHQTLDACPLAPGLGTAAPGIGTVAKQQRLDAPAGNQCEFYPINT